MTQLAASKSDSVTPSRKKNTGGRPTKRSGLVEVDEFEPIDFKKTRTVDLIIEELGGVSISGYWTDGSVVRLPRIVCVSVAGVNIHPKDAVDDRNAYIRALQEKTGDVLLASIQAEGHIYSTYKEAAEFSKRFTSLLLRHVRMSDPEFLQVCRTSRLDPANPNNSLSSHLSQFQYKTNDSEEYFSLKLTTILSVLNLRYCTSGDVESRGLR